MRGLLALALLCAVVSVAHSDTPSADDRSTAAQAQAGDEEWPTDPNTRVVAQIAACVKGRAAICLTAADELRRHRIASRLGYTAASLRAKARTLYEEQCAAGSGDACFERGRLLVRDGDRKAGSAMIRRGCAAGSGLACMYLGQSERDANRALELLDQACRQGAPHGCELLAHERGARDRAIELHRKACAGDDIIGCIHSGEQRRDAGDRAGAFADLGNACDLGDGTGCDLAGSVAPTPTRARELFDTACRLDVGSGCIHLGELVASGQGGARDWGHGLELVAQGCALAHDKRCKRLVELRTHPPDWECTTVEQCRRHCDEELWPACRRLAELAGPADEVDRTALYEQACEGKDVPACRARGDLDPSFANALPWYQRGCKLRDATACTYVTFSRATRSSSGLRALRSACSAAPGAPACALYGLALARRKSADGAKVLRAACAATLGIACRWLAGIDGEAYVAFRDDTLAPGYDPYALHGGTCDCEDVKPRSAAEIARDESRHREANRLLRLGCAAGDATSCDAVKDDDPPVTPPATLASVPAWQ